MNKVLRETIVEHILASFIVIPSSFIAYDKSKSLKSKEYLLVDTVSFKLDEEVIKNKVWGCQLSQHEIKILLVDCSVDKTIPEYAFLISVKDQPTYGLYLVYNDEDIDGEALIAVSMNGKDWLECNTFLQATFLAGMESLKELGLAWEKCSDYKDQLSSTLSFIKFHNDLYGDSNER